MRYLSAGLLPYSLPVRMGASCIRLEKIEILVVFPGGRLVALPYTGLLEPLRKPARLVALEFEEIIDEYVSELAPIQRFALERVQRGGEVWGQRRARVGIGGHRR